MMTPSENAYDIVKRSEGFRPTAYRCPGNVWTLAFGHTKGVKEGDVCTLAQGEAWLHEDMAETAAAVNRLVHVPLTQNQFDALMSFVFNIGQGAFAQSTMLDRLTQGDYVLASAEFPKWKKAGGRVQPGLVTRRQRERDLFERA